MERFVFPHTKQLSITIIHPGNASKVVGTSISAGQVHDVRKNSVLIVHVPPNMKGLPDKDIIIDPSQTLSKLVKLNEGVRVEIPHITVCGVPFNDRIAVGRQKIIGVVENRIAELSKKMDAGKLQHGSSEIEELNKLRGLRPLLQ